MKRKGLLIAASLALASVTLFASCSQVTTEFTSRWYKNTALSSNISGTEETLTYAVAYDNTGVSNADYTLAYDNGSYTTKLVNTTYTWESGSTDNVYKYTTLLKVDATFTVAGESKTYSDEVSTEVIFKSVENSLAPISSVKTVSSHSPASSLADSLSAVKYYHYSFTTQYDKACKNATLTYKKLSDDESDVKDSTNELSIPSSYTYLDNEQLLFAVRGMSMGSSLSETVTVLNASRNIMQNVTVSTSSVAEGTFDFAIDGNRQADGNKLTYNAVTIGINSTQSGTAQVAYYAATTNTDNNTYRNVMLFNRSYLPYSLGSLTYTLTDAHFTTK